MKNERSITLFDDFSMHQAKIITVCIGVFLSTACSKTAPPPPLPAPAVEVVTIMPRDVPIQHEWVGILDGYVNATIRPQVTGYLIKQNYREGEAVKKGQVLFEIDARTFQTTVEQAKAARSQQQANHATAAANLARIKPLAEKNAVSRKDLDDAIGSELSARAALDQTTAALETARLNLDFTRITSPIDGVAGIAKAQIGDLLSPTAQTELTTVSTLDPIKVYISLSEQEYLRHLKAAPGNKADSVPLELILSDGSVYPETGKFILLDRQVDASTGTFKLGAVFPNKNNLLRPGLFGKVRATISVKKDALLVPQRAVTEIQGKYLVAVVGPGNVVDVRPVKPAERIGTDWIISEGLKAGESIIMEGTQKVRPGSIVQIKNAPPAPAKAAAENPPGPENKPAEPAKTEPAAPAPEKKG